MSKFHTILSKKKYHQEMNQILDCHLFIRKEKSFFKEKKRVRPLQCDYLFNFLSKLENSILELCKIINSPNYPKINTFQNTDDYLFLNDLYSIKRQTSNLKTLVSKFRSISSTNTKKQQKSQREIYINLETISNILEHLNDEFIKIREQSKSKPIHYWN